MFRSLGIVQACFHLPRFRSNVMCRLGGRPLLEWVVRRVTDSTRLGGVIVAACDATIIAGIGGVVPSDVPLFLRDLWRCVGATLPGWKPTRARAWSVSAATTCSSIRR